MPTGFVPTQDKQYLVAFAQLPDGASLDRTEAVIRRMSDIGLKQPGVRSAVAFPGLSISGFSVAPNAGIVFFTLKPFEERKHAESQRPGHRRRAEPEIRRDPGCVHPHRAAAAGAWASARSADSNSTSKTAPTSATTRSIRTLQGIIGKSYQTPGLAGVFSTFTVNVPQLDADIDRVKAKTAGRAAAKSLRDDADLSRLALRERLQPLWPHLPGHRAGRRASSATSPRTSPGSRRAMTRAKWCRSARWSK